jgi:hypothetical protein
MLSYEIFSTIFQAMNGMGPGMGVAGMGIMGGMGAGMNMPGMNTGMGNGMNAGMMGGMNAGMGPGIMGVGMNSGGMMGGGMTANMAGVGGGMNMPGRGVPNHLSSSSSMINVGSRGGTTQGKLSDQQGGAAKQWKLFIGQVSGLWCSINDVAINAI